MKVLVIVDMQNDFIDGALGSAEAQAIVPNVVNKLKNTNMEETLLLFTQQDNYPTHYDNIFNASVFGRNY